MEKSVGSKAPKKAPYAPPTLQKRERLDEVVEAGAPGLTTGGGQGPTPGP